MKRNNFLFLIITIILTAPVLYGIFHPGFFISDDGNWMVIRFSAFFENLRNGQFPVRFLSRLNGGYGYPVADFLYPLFMYLATPLHILKFSFLDSIKIIFALSFVLSSVFSFLWLRKLFGNLASLVGSLTYTLFPYHLWDMYKRGSVGEVLALSIVPLILWAIEIENLALIGVGYALLILAHNSLALFFIPILLIYQFLSGSKKSIKSLKGIELGLILSCFFWLPALYDKQFTIFDSVKVSDYSSYFVKDFNLFGLITVVSVLGSLMFLREKNRRFIFFFLISLISIFFSLYLSKGVWQFLPFINLIQFPFRILSVLTLAVSFLISYQVEKIQYGFDKYLAFCAVVIIFISALPFVFPANYQDYPDSFYSTNQDSTTVKNEYMPKWVKNLPQSFSSKVINLDGEENIIIIGNNPNKISLQGNFTSTRNLQVNTVYFPGWQVFVDGKMTKIDYNSNGLIRFSVPSGNHQIRIEFGETTLRLTADSVSAIGFIILVLLLTKSFKKNIS